MAQKVLALVGGKVVEVEVASGSSGVPTSLLNGETFTVGARTQVPWVVDIDIAGEFVIDGELVEVA